MPEYRFRCEDKGQRMLIPMLMVEVPSIGDQIECVCCDGQMTRVINKVNFAEVRGTASNRIGMALEDRAELGRRRSGEWQR